MATVSIRTRLWLVALALCAMACLPACYTLFRHPRLSQLNYQRPGDTRCQTCHSSDDLWRFTHPSALPHRTGPWGAFYDVPWWYERRWQVAGQATTTADSTAPSTEER